MIDFRLLGPLNVTSDTKSVTPSAPKVRTVLALLLLRANTKVTVDQLIDELWESGPPARVKTTLQTYIYHLRKQLSLADTTEADEPSVPATPRLLTSTSGYLLRAAPKSLDTCRFEDLAAHGRAAMEKENLKQAGEMFRSALDLWRGPALGDVAIGPVGRPDLVRLESSRLSVLGQRVEVDLILGRHHELIGELLGQIEQNHTHEELHGQLMVALYRSGRRSEALTVYQRLRNALGAELGVDPAASIQRLHLQMLNADHSLDERSGPGGTGRVRMLDDVARNRPSQLPSDAVELIGRDAESTRLSRLITEAGRGTPLAVEVSGVPGVGASAFCVHVAHLVSTAFPDGQFHADLGGARSANAEIGEVLAGFLRAIGFTDNTLPADTAERVTLFHDWTRRHRVLVVLDGVTYSEQLDALLPTGPGCAALVIARRRLSDPRLTLRHELRPLSQQQSVELLANVLGEQRVNAEPNAANDLAALCGGLPAALRAASARLLVRPHWLLRRLVTQLVSSDYWADGTERDDLPMRFGVEATVRLLDDAQRRQFLLLAEHACRVGQAGMLVSIDSAADALGTGRTAAECLLELLTEVHLAEAEPTGTDDEFRYRLHPVVTAIARAVGHCGDASVETDSLRERTGARAPG